MLWSFRLLGQSGAGPCLQPQRGALVESTPSRREGACGQRTGHKGKLHARVWEKQRRGLAHLHGVIAVGTPSERAWAEVYMTGLREMAPRYGFGFVDGWHKIGRKFWPGVQAGAYLSSYFAGRRGRKLSITENVLADDLPRLVVFVGRDLTRATGCTMRSLRNARRLWASREGHIDLPALTLDEWLTA